MRRHLFLVIALSLTARLHALEPAVDPALATIRIKSHGASGTIVASTEGRSWILGCAHMFADEQGKPSEAARQRPLKMDGPVQPYAPRKKTASRLLACDYELDLCLIEVDNGPFHFIPVAKVGHKPGVVLWSLGYDNMSWPVTKKPATILQTTGDTTYTREKPWHGRSGGGLIDAEARCLIGVVQGYEVWPNQRGLYVSHAAILRFLAKHLHTAPRPPPAVPPPVPRQPLMLPPSQC
jgi:hypothetical protein